MGTITHNGVLPLTNVIESEYGLVTVYPFAADGDCYNYLVDHRGAIGEPAAKMLVYQVLKALAYLHEHHICHGDIKLENLLLMSHGITENNVRLTDFGLAAPITNGVMRRNATGSREYMAPELWNGEQYNEKVDLWAVGVMLFLSLTFRYPEIGEDFDHLATNTGDSESGAGRISEEAVDLMKKLMNPNPEGRISAKDAISHPWFSGYGNGIEMQGVNHTAQSGFA
jgi:serine/threonine protein kinase